MKPGRTAFALTELLVVIATLTLLAAMPFPVSSRAKAQATLIRCIRNEKQIGQGFAFYAAENKDKFPVVTINGLPDELYSGDCWAGKQGKDLSGDVILRYTNRVMNAYVCTPEQLRTNFEGAMLVFKCPADNGAEAALYIERKPTVFDCVGWSYLFNASANGAFNQRGLFLKKQSDIGHPSRIVLVSDFAVNCFYGNSRPFEKMYWHNARSLGYGNVLFVDGHVDYVRATVNKPDYTTCGKWSFVYNY